MMVWLLLLVVDVVAVVRIPVWIIEPPKDEVQYILYTSFLSVFGLPPVKRHVSSK